MTTNSISLAKIVIGQQEIESWYSAPYPEEYVRDGRIYLCEFCLSYVKSEYTLQRHNSKCPIFRPPANEIYRSKHKVKKLGTQELSVYEVDGAKAKLYCQNLCLLAKAFLDHKTLYYDVDHFLFYILTKNDDVGSRILGYFSKEKHCTQKNNVSCIMILPQYQSFGFGRFLIEFSYLLSKKENSLGTPEKPLSELGKISYLNYWKYSIIDVIRKTNTTTLRHIIQETSMTKEDIMTTLYEFNMIKPDKHRSIIQYKKSDLNVLNKPRLTVRPEDLRWTQYVSIYAKKLNQDQDGDLFIDEVMDVESVCSDATEIDSSPMPFSKNSCGYRESQTSC